jgi:hypothetical protein
MIFLRGATVRHVPTNGVGPSLAFDYVAIRNKGSNHTERHCHAKKKSFMTSKLSSRCKGLFLPSLFTPLHIPFSVVQSSHGDSFQRYQVHILSFTLVRMQWLHIVFILHQLALPWSGKDL